MQSNVHHDPACSPAVLCSLYLQEAPFTLQGCPLLCAGLAGDDIRSAFRTRARMHRHLKFGPALCGPGWQRDTTVPVNEQPSSLMHKV